jgi:uncharacterized repeat protein (TIGR03803 family)
MRSEKGKARAAKHVHSVTIPTSAAKLAGDRVFRATLLGRASGLGEDRKILNTGLKGAFMTLRGVLCSRLISVASVVAIALFLGLTASAQDTPVLLFKYPNTINNTTGIANSSFLAQGPDGVFYDTIFSNGQFNNGSVYTMSLSGAFTLLFSFCAEGGFCTVNGTGPQGGVTLGSDGNFYGTTSGGGAGGQGTVFKITPAGKLTTLFSFPSTGADGSNPTFRVFQASNGEFYGVTPSGGNTNGTFFSITTAGSFKLLASFHSGVNGSNPNLPTQGADGNFYGTTHNGGPNSACCGVVYKATPAGKITVLFTFASGEGSSVGQLVQGSDGNFWGVTNGVPFISGGELFKVSATGHLTVVHTFGAFQGDADAPVSGLIAGSDGFLYGVTNAGGKANVGAIYSVNPATDAYAVLYSFCATSPCDAFGPSPVLAQDTNGTFFGNTGGNSDGGSYFFSFDTGLGPFVRTLTQSGRVGATVSFLGQDFTLATKVEFGGASATFKVISDTELTAVVPAAAVTGAVKVITSKGTLSATSKFKVLPTIKSISPTSGSVGTVVTVTGTGLTGATKVTVGGIAATFKAVSGTEVEVTVPTGAKTGAISIATAGGSASSSTFTVAP